MLKLSLDMAKASCLHMTNVKLFALIDRRTVYIGTSASILLHT